MLPSMSDRDGLIWLDGELVDWREAKVHVLTHTLHYGMGVFEGVRAYETAQKLPFSKAEINEAQRAAVRENNLKSAYIRPMAFYGSEGMGLRAENLKVHVMVAAWEWPAYMGEEAKTQGIKIRTSSFTRHHVNITMCKAKANGNYMNSMLALREALDSGCEEALLLDNEGYVAEGSGENFFMITNGIMYTPELTSCLDGITRRTIMEMARAQGIEVREKRITRDEVYIADEAFFTGTAAEVLPIRSLDGRIIGEGRRGPVTEMLQNMYFDTVTGKDPFNAEWVTPVK